MSELFSSGSLRTPYPHQDHALTELRAAIHAGARRPIVQLPTGGGKTVVGAHIITGALRKKHRVAFTVPRLSLVDQTVTAFEANGIECVGVMQGRHERTDRGQPVQVISAQTLLRRTRPDVDLVIVDEAHELHKAVLQWISDAPDTLFVGMTATPWTRGLGKYYDHLVIGASISDLIAVGRLSPFRVFAPSPVDLSGVSTVAGEFHQGQLSEVMNADKLVGDIVREWRTRGEGRPTLCFCVDRAHAKHICERFIEADVAAEYLDCFSDRFDRSRGFDRFIAGETKIICNVGILTTGVDLPFASCVIDAHPTKSEIRLVQTIGRGLRTAAGKRDCLILDHAGNALRLGLVTDIYRDTLDDGKPRQASQRDNDRVEPLPKLCPECKAVVSRRAKVCPQCDAVLIATSHVRSTDDELVEYGSGGSGKRAPTLADQRHFFAELLGIVEIKGCKPGWAAHKFREKYGDRPSWAVKNVAPTPPSIATRNWVKSRAIAWAKSQGGRHRYG